jgi:hypothetical protein
MSESSAMSGTGYAVLTMTRVTLGRLCRDRATIGVIIMGRTSALD